MAEITRPIGVPFDIGETLAHTGGSVAQLECRL